MRQYLDDTFLRSASDILGETNAGLSTIQIIDKCNSFGYEYNVDVPISNLDKMKYRNIPNKRTVLYENLRCFNAQQQFNIISSMCEEKSQNEREDVIKLKSKLITKYPDLATEGIIYKQLSSNPKIELCGMYDGGTWLRVTATVKEDNRIEVQRAVLDDPTGPKQLYTAGDGRFITYKLTEVKALKYNFYAAPEEIK